MGFGSESQGKKPWARALWGPAAPYFYKKLGVFQDTSRKPTRLTDVSPDPAEGERQRRRQGGQRSTILGPASRGGGNTLVGGY